MGTTSRNLKKNCMPRLWIARSDMCSNINQNEIKIGNNFTMKMLEILQPPTASCKNVRLQKFKHVTKVEF